MYGNSYTWTSYVVLVVKKLPANAGDTRDSGLIPGSGRAPGGEMATHSSILAWEIPWTEQPGGLQSMGLQSVRHDWACMHACSKHGWSAILCINLLYMCIGASLFFNFALSCNVSNFWRYKSFICRQDQLELDNNSLRNSQIVRCFLFFTIFKYF